ncbi:hypothetical protein [Noviherbaspirillum sp. Root189]|uniref:hypothetical protein n=1 Tax=Noviherbaspirillum sp. Root189 TaxID=1736487 RepID=UPI00070EF9F5|nr:hypothetical protein [Noviherbaspirillum sp. Root189]KRB84946.1 hypothetical protein ASE07_22145 [Noviherbaspirillum sp. Root189]
MTDFQQSFSGVPGQQLMPQGLFGGLLGGPLGGFIGKGIGGLFGNPGLGSQIGQMAGGIGGSLLPFSADPMMAAYAQQQQQQQLQQLQQLQHLHQLQQLQQAQQAPQSQQLAPQGFFGNLLGQIGQPLGGAIGGIFGNAGLGSTIGGAAGQLGRMLPFSADPIAQAYAMQQAQLAPQSFFGNLLNRPLNGMISPTIGSLPIGTPIPGNPFMNQIQHQLPFGAQQGLQGQLAPQGFFGDLIGQIGQPLGGAIGGLFGNAGLGSTIGGAAGQLGRLLPFGADPISQAYAMQQAQQAQLAPQGFFGNLLGQIGQPLGNAIGGMFGNAGLGGTIGGAAGQFGRLLPFGADGFGQPFGQQFGQQGAGQQQTGPYPGFQNQQSGFFGGQPTLH